jgi:hypothetical protein
MPRVFAESHRARNLLTYDSRFPGEIRPISKTAQNFTLSAPLSPSICRASVGVAIW